MNKPSDIDWKCVKRDGCYVIVGRLGALEICEMIEAVRWNRAVDRCLIFRRAVGNISRTIQNVISAGL